MELSKKWESLPPRVLKYRSHYRLYTIVLALAGLAIFSYWALKVSSLGWNVVTQDQPTELIVSAFVLTCISNFYLLWLAPKLKKSIQVFNDHLVLHDGKKSQELKFTDIDSVRTVYWSLFYITMKNGHKFYFTSSLERVDYIWEGLRAARPDLMSEEEFETFRLKLVQHDHHQKRKEWFFRHRTTDIFNWIALPVLLVGTGFYYQSQQVQIYQEGLYFFRLFMFSFIILILTAFFFSLVLKKYVFDRKIKKQMDAQGVKVRDMEFEGVIIQRSKIFQIATACFLFSLLVRMDINLYSVTKVKEDLASLDIKKGHTILIDNRYNCVRCTYQVKDGDMVVFGRGYIGQVMASQGEMVGEVSQDRAGRFLASSNVQEVPYGHIAVKASNNKDIIFVKVDELIGKIQK